MTEDSPERSLRSPGGQPGWANPLAFIRAARERFAGPLVLAGGISDGAALWAAVAAGCDLGYMGTRFIATTESRADDEYRAMLLAATLDDVVLTSAVTGIPVNALSASLDGVSADASPSGGSGGGFDEARLHQQSRVRPAGHTVGAVRTVVPVADLVAQVRAEYRSAQNRSLALAGRPVAERSASGRPASRTKDARSSTLRCPAVGTEIGPDMLWRPLGRLAGGIE